MKIVRTETKQTPKYDSLTDIYTVMQCTGCAYEAIRDEFKNNLDNKILEPVIYVDVDGNWTMGLKINNKKTK
jgi:uncharacterized protein (DUF2225 family)